MAEVFVIGDTDTVLGFAHAGVPGEVVEEPEEARRAFAGVVEAGEVKLLIITEGVAERIRQEVNRVRFGARMPVIVEIPGPEGPLPGRRTLMELIREAVGIRV